LGTGVYRSKKIGSSFFLTQEIGGHGDFAVEKRSTGIKILAAQKIWVVTFSFQGGDF
jgi:hypothetical protein